MIFTPASTSRSATSWAASAGTASTPTTTSSSATTWARSSLSGRTTTSPISCPTFDSSTSKTATTWKPWSAKIAEEAIAWPRWPAPKRAMLCWPAVRRILRISETSESTLYPTPRLPNLPKPERSRRICVGLMWVYSESSCEEIVSRPILRACVRTCRYRERRAATPSERRSPSTGSPAAWISSITSAMPPQYRAWPARLPRRSGARRRRSRRPRPPGSSPGAGAAGGRRSRCRSRAVGSGTPRCEERRDLRSPARTDGTPAASRRGPRSCSHPFAGGEGVVAEVVGVGDGPRPAGSGADHRRVVGAEGDRDELQADTFALAELGHGGAQRSVGGHAAAQRHRLPAPLAQGAPQLRHQLVDHGFLERGGKVGAALPDPVRSEFLAAVEDRRLQPAEGEVEARVALHRDRHLERFRVPLLGLLLDQRTARVAEAEQPGRLVERLPGGVVEGLAEDLVALVVAHRRQHGVAAGGDQAEEGRLQRFGLEEVGGDVALQVIDRDQRQPAGGGDRLRGRDPDQEGADQPGPGGGGDRLDVVQSHPGLAERRLDHRGGQLQVVAGGDLGDDAAEARVGGGLRGDHVGEDAPAVEHGGAGVVAGRLDGEEQASAPQSSHMISASSPLSW